MYVNRITGEMSTDPAVNLVQVIEPRTLDIPQSTAPSVMSAKNTKEPEPVVVDSVPFETPVPPPEEKKLTERVGYNPIPTIDSLPNFNTLNPENVNQITSGKIEDSPIFNQDLVVSESKLNSLTSAMMFPSYFINDKLGIEASKYSTSKTIETANKWLDNAKTPTEYQQEADKIINSASPDSSKSQNGFIDYSSIPRSQVGKGNSTIRTGEGNGSNFDAAKIDKFIQSNSGGKSQLTGQQVLDISKEYNIDPSLILAQGLQESHFGTQGAAAQTNNPFNVGNTDNGNLEYQSSIVAGLKRYASVLSKEYNPDGGKTLYTLDQFINSDARRPDGARYATDSNYIPALKNIQNTLKKQDLYSNSQTSTNQTPQFDTAQSRSVEAIEPLKTVKKFYDTYKDKTVGNPENSYFGECVSLVRSYYKQALNINMPVFGNAWEGLTDPRLDSQFKTITKDYRPQINDVFFMNQASDMPYGHTGIVVGSPQKDNTVLIMEQNWNGKRTPSLRQIPIGNISGVRRYIT